MSVQKFFDKLRDIKDVSFATIGLDGSPKVRIIDIMITEGEKLYFLTARGKEFYRELQANSKVAVVGLNKEWQMIRVEGKVRHENQNLLQRIFTENPSMNDVYPGESRNILEIFSIFAGQGEYFDLSTSPIERVPFKFGNASELQKKGFRITDNCIKCGKCKKNCPQNSIIEGNPYLINQESCLHCGLCYEECPADAVERL